MKKTVYTLATIVFFAGTVITSCTTSPSQKIEHAEEKVLDAKKEVKEAQSELNVIQQDFDTDYKQFRIVYDNKINANEKSIAELKLNIASANQENKVLYQKKLAELERKNNDLKIELVDYKADGADEWNEFKTEFKNDMDELGKEFADFTITREK
jgi:hypothetical protein